MAKLKDNALIPDLYQSNVGQKLGEQQVKPVLTKTPCYIVFSAGISRTGEDF